MKQLKTILFALVMQIVPLPSVGQNMNFTDDGLYGSLYLGGGYGTFSSSDDDQSFTDLIVGYTPIGYDVNNFCVDLGIEMHYSFYNSNGLKFNMTTERLPVKAHYNINISDNVSIAPLAGIYADWNLSGKLKSKNTGAEINLFKKRDWANSDDVYKRFKFGWLAGIRIQNSSFFFDFSYCHDFTKLQKSSNLSSGIAMLTFGAYVY